VHLSLIDFVFKQNFSDQFIKIILAEILRTLLVLASPRGTI